MRVVITYIYVKFCAGYWPLSSNFGRFLGFFSHKKDIARIQLTANRIKIWISLQVSILFVFSYLTRGLIFRPDTPIIWILRAIHSSKVFSLSPNPIHSYFVRLICRGIYCEATYLFKMLADHEFWCYIDLLK